MFRKATVAFACAVTAALCCGVTLDLRPRRSAAPKTRSAAVPEKGVLRATSLPPGASKTDRLSVGDSVKLLLYDDVEIDLALTEVLESPLGGRTFLASADGTGGMRTAVVIETDEGLQVSADDLPRGRVYTVASSSGGVSVRESDPAAEPVTCGDALRPAAKTAARAKDASVPMKGRKASSATKDASETLVDVLVAYEAGAAAWAESNGGGVTNFAQRSVAKMNMALANNAIDSLFRFRLVGVVRVEASTTNLTDALNAATDGAGAWYVVQEAREETGADVTTVMIDTGSAYGFTGLGWSMTSTDPDWIADFSEQAFNTVSVRSADISHTMTHEVGHNMGCGHCDMNGSVDPGPQSFAYSRGYYFNGGNGTSYHTIMAYNSDGNGKRYEPAPVFSSPDVLWTGVPAGDSDHDNAQVIRRTFAIVAGFREQARPVSPWRPVLSPSTSTDEATAKTFSGKLKVTISPMVEDAVVRYTLDGTDPRGDGALEYDKPIYLKNSALVRCVELDSENEPGRETRGLYLERHMISPGEWTSDAGGVRTAAAGNGKLICVALTSAADDVYSLDFQTVARSKTFSDWARTNGVYLVSADSTVNAESEAATDWFLNLCQAYTGSMDAYPVQMFFARASAPDVPVAQGLAIEDCCIGTLVYTGTAESLAACFSTVLSAIGEQASQFPGSSATNVFGTDGVTWTNDSTVPWRDEYPAAMRAGGFTRSYASELTATVTGKGRLVFDYAFTSYSGNNVFSFYVDNRKWLYKAYAGEITMSGTVTNDVTNSAGATFKWRYNVGAPDSDVGLGFIYQAGVRISNLRWFPESDIPVVRKDASGETVEVPRQWFRQKGLVSAAAGLAECESAADADPDGDGVPNWAEYVAGTNPLLSSDVPHCTIEMVDGAPVVEFVDETRLLEGYQAVIRGKKELDDPKWRIKNGTHRFFRAFIEQE